MSTIPDFIGLSSREPIFFIHPLSCHISLYQFLVFLFYHFHLILYVIHIHHKIYFQHTHWVCRCFTLCTLIAAPVGPTVYYRKHHEYIALSLPKGCSNKSLRVHHAVQVECQASGYNCINPNSLPPSLPQFPAAVT